MTILPDGLKELTIEELREAKLLRLRSIRDGILSKMDWVSSLRQKEDSAIELGLITEENRRWTDDQYKSYLVWCQTMRDVPENVCKNNFQVLDSTAWEDIVNTNTNIFPVCNLDEDLSEIPSTGTN